MLLNVLYREPELIAERGEISSRKEILKVVGQCVGQPMEVVSPTRQGALHDALRAATIEAPHSVLNFLSGDQLTERVILNRLDETQIDAAERGETVFIAEASPPMPASRCACRRST